MSRLIFVSNLLPLKIYRNKKGETALTRRIGGFTSGLDRFDQTDDTLWVGWTGLDRRDLSPEKWEEINIDLKKKNCFPISLRKQEREKYLEGFANGTIWPLFHYYNEKSTYREKEWMQYVRVNNKYADELEKIVRKGDTVWIHDYHLMLLPKMLRERFPDLTIGYFQHIPFPSYEVFRLLPWRIEVLEGLLGADLIGFHTYDYERHFISSLRRLLGLDTYFNQITYQKRKLKVDNFPMGIDYEKFHNRSSEIKVKVPEKLANFHHEIEKHVRVRPGNKIILLLERLDYTKGLINRVKAYREFLEKNENYRRKVSLLMYITTLRENDPENKLIKAELDQQVGKINSEYGRIDWTPVFYFFRELNFDQLVEVYVSSDIALVTPLRDGMNLVSKEFIASKPDQKGVLILSEMAGASKEMGEAVIVNPNNRREISDAICQALSMPEEEQIRRNKALQKRLSTYTNKKWATDFLEALKAVKKNQEYNLTRKINNRISKAIIDRYKSSNNRMIFLDYDGTLQGFFKDPQDAKPDKELYSILKKLTADKKNNVVIISGRDKETLSNWFNADWRIGFIAEHGVWHKKVDGQWHTVDAIDKDWMEIIKPILDFYVDRTPRSFIEEKNYSLVWHYRDSDPDLGVQRSYELKDELQSLVTNLNLEIMDGDKVIEIKNSGINKGRAALSRMGNNHYDFILAMGDDWTDEFTFEYLPEETITIKVGEKSTRAKYFVDGYKNIREILKTVVK
ncbi:MAG TPA: bifunctional alpha,alpha-trehalose-phosphate synthase (UDP-forming)/trehalose-phosphatase [Bacteroidales bacterium]|nr:bifunctional alpha,alpha-trehalose-phosphate synthase (UDP-forming)/trehalose-phosphatase [Bacteroidales bacterium]